MVGGVPANLPDGPFVNMGTLHSIQQLVRSQHQCLIAEIAFDPDVIPPGADPSDLRQARAAQPDLRERPESRRVGHAPRPQTFEIRPTPAGRPVGFPHDELMIEWGDVPAGSSASIYLPASSASDVLAIADQTYTSHRLTALDANTIGCAAEGVTYVPIPPGQQAENFAGLLTVDLPAGIHQGERHDVTVKQVTVVPVLERDVRDDEGHVGAVGENGKTAFGTGWRRVLGVFTMTITVGTKHRLLAGEERLLSILRWIELSIPVESRWYLVFRRYVDQIAHRVRFMGGDPTAIGPTSDGDWQHLRPGEHGERGHGADGERPSCL